jgi:hypothetical protein
MNDRRGWGMQQTCETTVMLTRHRPLCDQACPALCHSARRQSRVSDGQRSEGTSNIKKTMPRHQLMLNIYEGKKKEKEQIVREKDRMKRKRCLLTSMIQALSRVRVTDTRLQQIPYALTFYSW